MIRRCRPLSCATARRPLHQAFIKVFPDFASIPEVKVKKQMFFDFLERYIAEQNVRVSHTRERLLELSDVVAKGDPLSDDERSELIEIAERTFSMVSTALSFALRDPS